MVTNPDLSNRGERKDVIFLQRRRVARDRYATAYRELPGVGFPDDDAIAV